MMNWRLHRKLIILVIALCVLLAANLVLFVPRFVHQSRLLTATELNQDSQQLRQIAQAGAILSQKISQHTISPTDQEQTFNHLLRQTDDLIVRLQTAPHVIPLEDQAKQTLELAQIISFTLRDLQVQPPSQTRDLKAANTAQVLDQAANTASTLEASKP